MCSQSVKDIPQLMVPNPNAATEPNRPLTIPEGLHYECHLTFAPPPLQPVPSHHSPLGGESPPPAAVGGLPPKEHAMNPDISVVIATHNQRARLRLVLCGLAGQHFPKERFEIIVVDDGCTDGNRRHAGR